MLPHSGDQALDFMRLMWALDHGLQVRSKRMERELGLTGPQRLVVRLVSQFPAISAGELADLLHVHKSTLTGVLQRLVERGLVARTSDTADARRVRLTLTARGARAARPRGGTIEAAVRHVIARLSSSELATARRVLGEITAALMRGHGYGPEPTRMRAANASKRTVGNAPTAPSRVRQQPPR